VSVKALNNKRLVTEVSADHCGDGCKRGCVLTVPDDQAFLGNCEVVFQPYGKRVIIQRNSTILDAAQTAAVDLRSTCGGRGECGKCRVIVEEGSVIASQFHDERFLSPEERSRGYHIACKSRIIGNLVVNVPLETRLENQRILSEAVIPRIEMLPRVMKKFLEPTTLVKKGPLESSLLAVFGTKITSIQKSIDSLRIRPIDTLDMSQGLTATGVRKGDYLEIVNFEKGDTSRSIYGVALDIGTTKVVAYLVHLKDGSILDVASDYNAQLLYGEDLISRIDFVTSKENGQDLLQKAIVDTINRLIEKTASRSNVRTSDILDICVAGNTVMGYLLVRSDPKPLNYSRTVVSRVPLISKAEEIGIKANRDAELFCMPNVSRWLGGDTVANILAAGLFESPEISVLIDMGTNGEIVIGKSGWLFSTSCASGPAFEGYEIRFGMRSVDGAIEKATIDVDTLRAEYTLIGEPSVRPRGICGSGIIDLASEMFRVGILDSRGQIQRRDSPHLREGFDGMEYVVVPSNETDLGKDITISQKDLEKFLDSKAATCAAISVLMRKAGLTISEVQVLYLSGAFGQYIDTQKAVTVGVFPEFPNAKIVRLGNGSIAGAYLALLSVEARKKATEIAKNMSYWDLVDDPLFTDEYYAALSLPGKPELFPTVLERLAAKRS
jgi:uncharacterized 2Fe-2S/4Fe-4S cluster protein (DUF4445 family)